MKVGNHRLAGLAGCVASAAVGMVFAVREPADDADLVGLPEMRLQGLDDDDARAALYDRLGLVGDQRRVPQVMLTYAGEHMRIGGAHELRMSGVQSLFGPTTIAAIVPAPSTVVMETAGMVVAEEGHACCE